MAKRKRLTPPNPGYLDPGPGTGGTGPFSGGVATVPIADVARDAAASAALDEMADTLARARNEGRMVLSLPLADVVADYLVRDRLSADGAEMDALKASLQARGQQTPIEVAEIGDGRYGLISGWRRCEALRQLAAETGEARFGDVLALLRRPEEASDSYIAMVEENEIRVGLSYYERARIVSKAAEQGVYPDDRAALSALFASASRPKRSKIGSFLAVVAALDGALRFPEAIGERLGLVLSRALGDDPTLGPRLRAALLQTPPADAGAEQALIAAQVAPSEKPAKQSLTPPETPVPGSAPADNIFADTDPAPDSGPGMRQSAIRQGGTEVAPGVWTRRFFNGDIAISGDDLPPGLYQELRAWLADRL